MNSCRKKSREQLRICYNTLKEKGYVIEGFCTNNSNNLFDFIKKVEGLGYSGNLVGIDIEMNKFGIVKVIVDVDKMNFLTILYEKGKSRRRAHS